MAKIRSLLGRKVIPDVTNIGRVFVTDDNDEVNVPTPLAQSLLKQTEAWTTQDLTLLSANIPEDEV